MFFAISLIFMSVIFNHECNQKCCPCFKIIVLKQASSLSSWSSELVLEFYYPHLWSVKLSYSAYGLHNNVSCHASRYILKTYVMTWRPCRTASVLFIIKKFNHFLFIFFFLFVCIYLSVYAFKIPSKKSTCSL